MTLSLSLSELKDEWCLKKRTEVACSVKDPLIIITIIGGGTNECVDAAGVACNEQTYTNIGDVQNAESCGTVCNGYNSKDTCGAFTHFKDDADSGKEKCFFLGDCLPPVDADLPNSCYVGVNTEEMCASGGYLCDEPPKDPCTTPDGVDHDYSRPENRQWSRPCLLAGSDKQPDEGCDVYIKGNTCQHGTVCKLEPSVCKDSSVPKVTHTCSDGIWKRQENEVGDDEVTDWKSDACYPCAPTPVAKEPGLSLFCSEPDDGAPDGDNLMIKKGPCSLYCDGFLVHNIYCDLNLETPVWKDSKNPSAKPPFYCWKKP